MKKFLLFAAIVACISLIGCGQKEPEQSYEKSEEVVENQATEKEYNNEETPSTEEAVNAFKQYAPEEYESVKETANSIEVTSNGNMYSFNVADNATAIYHHDGEKITGYEVHVEYETAEDAQLAKNANDYTDEDDVESITVDGSTIIVKFKPSAYEDTTLEDIQQTAELLKALQGN